ncbi:MAG: hypothetical protein JKY88_07820 [Pseudomonadales bacterium]|nr:hypothetical protein [Pseudomonadales bacterium]
MKNYLRITYFMILYTVMEFGGLLLSNCRYLYMRAEAGAKIKAETKDRHDLSIGLFIAFFLIAGLLRRIACYVFRDRLT